MGTEKKITLGLQGDVKGADKVVRALSQVKAAITDVSANGSNEMRVLSTDVTQSFKKMKDGSEKQINTFRNIVQDNLGNVYRQTIKQTADQAPRLLSQSFKQINKDAYSELSAATQSFKNFGNLTKQTNDEILKSAGYFGKTLRQDVGKPVSLISSDIVNSQNAQGEAVRKTTAIWKDEFGKTIQTVYQDTAKGAKALTTSFVKLKDTTAKTPILPPDQLAQASTAMGRLGMAVKGVEGVAAESFTLISGKVQTTKKGVELFTETFTNQMGQKVVITSQKTAQGLVPISKNIETVGKEAEKSFQQMNDFQKALRRMALVVPIWMAGRAALQTVFQTVKEGSKTIMDYERAMARAAVMSSDLTDATNQLAAVQDQTRRLMLETGVEFGKAAEGYTLLKTAGIDYETSLKAQELILKTSVGLMGDVEQTARSAADIYNVMGDTITGASSEYEKFAIILGTGSKLFQQNAFELKDFEEAMKKTAGIAQTSGLTFQEQAAILGSFAQVGLRGAEGATALRQALVFLSKQPKVVQDLIKIDPKDLSTIDVIKNVFQSLFQLIQSGQRGEALRFAEELFGTRGIKTTALATSQGIRTLIKDLEDASAIGVSAGIGLINTNFEKVNNTAGEQANILKRVQGELGKTFIQGITGSDDFKTAIINLRQTLQSLEPTIRGTGDLLRTYIIDPLLLLPRLNENLVLETQVGNVESFKPLIDSFRALTEEFDSTKAQELISSLKAISAIGFADRFESVTNLDVTKLISRLEDAIVNQGFVRVPLEAEIIKISYTPEQIKKLQEEFPGIEIEGVDSRGGLYSGRTADADEAKRVAEEQLTMAEKLIQQRIKLLQLQGATTSEQLKAQAALEHQYFGQVRMQTVLEQQLETERKINEQKREQYGYSSESIKLMEIANRYGLDTAKQIANVLQTSATPADLTEGARRVYEQQFADRYQQFQAEQFFTRGAGRDINISERGLQGTGNVFTRDNSNAITTRTARGVINAPISMPVSVNVDPSSVISKVESTIVKELRNPNSQLTKELKELFEKF